MLGATHIMEMSSLMFPSCSGPAIFMVDSTTPNLNNFKGYEFLVRTTPKFLPASTLCRYMCVAIGKQEHGLYGKAARHPGEHGCYCSERPSPNAATAIAISTSITAYSTAPTPHLEPWRCLRS